MIKKFLAVTVAVFGLLLTSVATATAAYDPLEPDYSTSGKCSDIEFTATWPGGAVEVDNAELVVKVDSTGLYEHVAVGESITVERPTVDTEIQYRAWGGQERDYDNPALTDEGLAELVAWLEADDTRTPVDAGAPGVNWKTLDVTGCPVEVTPEAPTVTQAECVDGELVPGQLTIPDIEGVSYNHESRPLEPTVHTALLVSADAEDGYVFPEGAEVSWTLNVNKAPVCVTPTSEPTQEPTSEPTQEPDPTADPTGEPTTDPTGDPTADPTDEGTPDSGGAADDEELPDTGANPWLVGLGASSVALGGAGVAMRRLLG